MVIPELSRTIAGSGWKGERRLERRKTVLAKNPAACGSF
jgi:hypothetical protein